MKSNAENVEGVKKSVFKLTKPVESIRSVSSGQRVSNETEPTVELTSQFNKLKLNTLAVSLMGLIPGDKVKFLITDEPTIDGKFLIGKTAETDEQSAKTLSQSGKTDTSLLFNYSGIYARLWQANVEAIEKGGESFVKEGVAVKKGNIYYLNEKVVYQIIPVDGVDEENPYTDKASGVVFTKLFALISPERIKVDLSKLDKVKEEDVEAVASQEGSGSSSDNLTTTVVEEEE